MTLRLPDVRPPKILVLITLALLLCTAIFGNLLLKPKLPDAIAIDIKDQPTLGYSKAVVHVVVFEEPKCSNCRLFTQQIYPKLKTEFIDTQKITYTVIPVSFLPGSMPAAVALLCVYHTDSSYPNAELYFSYLDYLYSHQPEETIDWATTDILVGYAEKLSPAISPQGLRKCIDSQNYRTKIQQNTEYGKRIMGGDIATPTIYVNGIEVKELNYDSVKDVIETLLERGGK
ncbi:MAG: thioredoxin domain-containing protein [Verrucomicrobia bacterium]|nr:thioredoxin domain-containing protein [Verrucomicrobiota bacterium]MBS0647449.1 thioredoxin domain-containing protein [Verrucomicrobiota bacterium]